MDRKITGVMMYYYYVCQRKLWYFYYDIQMEQESENVALGKILDETSYKREKKHINIDDVINIDFLSKEGILHEVKKSNKIEEASVWQVKYYLYYLRKYGVEISAKIDYPLLKKNLEVDLNEADIKVIENTLENIQQILSRDKPPEFQKSKICTKCAYRDLCFI